MRKKTPAEMEKARISKATRTLIRLKYSLEADEELNEVLPDTLDEFDKALVAGKMKRVTMDVEKLLNG